MWRKNFVPSPLPSEAPSINPGISAKIKSAQLEKIPWMLVIGQKEVDNSSITLRFLDGKQEFGLSLEKLLEKAKTENS